MKLEDQVTSLELSKKLKELGTNQESLWYWEDTSKDGEVEKWQITLGNGAFKNLKDFVSVFTVAELGEMLPKNIKSKNNIAWLQIEVQGAQDGWSCQYKDSNRVIKFFETRTISDSMAKMLIYLLENKLI